MDSERELEEIFSGRSWGQSQSHGKIIDSQVLLRIRLRGADGELYFGPVTLILRVTFPP